MYSCVIINEWVTKSQQQCCYAGGIELRRQVESVASHGSYAGLHEKTVTGCTFFHMCALCVCIFFQPFIVAMYHKNAQLWKIKK